MDLSSQHVLDQARSAVGQPINFDLDTLDRYQDLEERIQELGGITEQLDLARTNLKIITKEYQECKARVDKLAEKTQREQEDVRKLEKLTLTSLFANIRGTKDEKLRKEKLEHLDALNQEEEAKRELHELDISLNQAAEQVRELKAVVDVKEQLEQQLEALIHEVCEGVPDPVEDKVEEKLSSLQAQFGPLNERRGRLERAGNHLRHASSSLGQALNFLNSASNYSTWDTFLGGGLLADSLKHSKMADARNAVRHAGSSIQRARQEYPNLPHTGAAHVQDMNFMWDGFFDNIFSDWSARNKIHQSRDSVRHNLYQVNNALQWVDHELRSLSEQHSRLRTEIEQARSELLRERKRMIQEALGKS